MADESEDQWLYGDSGDSKKSESNQDETPCDENTVVENTSAIENSNESNCQEQTTEEKQEIETEKDTSIDKDVDKLEVKDSSSIPTAEKTIETSVENGTKDQEDSNDSESDSDDDVHVVIGDIKSTPATGYNSLNIKRSGLLTNAPSGLDNLKKQTGKFSIDDFETIGVINGIQAHEYNLDQIEDKPWRQPGADITDYFNYGFNEETWRAYCERQKRMRSESGVGLVLNAGGGSAGTGVSGGNGGGGGGGIISTGGRGGGGIGGGIGGIGDIGIGGNGPNQNITRISQISITNDNSKYSGIMGPKRAGPPPGRKMAGTIDVIGSSGLASRRNLDKSPPKENVIQVMTADRREYSRKPGFPDMSVPPPTHGLPSSFDMPPPPGPGYHANEPAPFYLPDPDSYYQSYEPTQDSQWGNDPTWQPTNLAIPLTHNDDDKTSGLKSIPTMVPPLSIPPLINTQREQRCDSSSRGPIERERGDRDIETTSRERDRDRDRSERDKDSSIRERDRDSLPHDDDKERERDRSRSQYRHKDRHRHRSRSRSRRHKSRSRSPSRRKKKSRRSDRERSKEDSE